MLSTPSLRASAGAVFLVLVVGFRCVETSLNVAIVGGAGVRPAGPTDYVSIIALSSGLSRRSPERNRAQIHSPLDEAAQPQV
jgi:hypothetical protein